MTHPVSTYFEFKRELDAMRARRHSPLSHRFEENEFAMLLETPQTAGYVAQYLAEPSSTFPLVVVAEIPERAFRSEQLIRVLLQALRTSPKVHAETLLFDPWQPVREAIAAQGTELLILLHGERLARSLRPGERVSRDLHFLTAWWKSGVKLIPLLLVGTEVLYTLLLDDAWLIGRWDTLNEPAEGTESTDKE
jgi:hypothetical protein